MDIRPWKPGDETAIRALFGEVFGSPMSEAFWNWRYRDHPAGPPMIMLAWDGDRLAAHYAASYAPLLIEGEPRLSALSMTTMTHADYRGQRLFEKTASALYEDISARGIASVWGFPSRSSNIPFRGKLGWAGIADIPLLSRALTPEEDFSTEGVTEVERLGPDFSAAPRMPAQISADRRSDYLAWRIDQNPVYRYIRLALTEAGDCAGYAVLKHWKDGEFDLVLLEAADAGSCGRLVQACLATVQARGGQRLNCWSLAHRSERIVLERAGFLPLGMVTNFGGRSFTPGHHSFAQMRSWKLDMIDSDLY